LKTKRGSSESFIDFESRFEAQISKFNSHSSLARLPDALVAFMLLANSNVDSSQRISVLAASSPNSDQFSVNASTDDYLSSVKYEQFASVIRQCDKKQDKDKDTVDSDALHASVVRAVKEHMKNTKPPRRTLTADQLANLKSKSKCRRCMKYGHWADDHNEDGSLKPGVTSTHEPPNSSSKPSTGSRAVTFNMVNLIGSNCDITEVAGPLLDDGAPYCGMGENEFKILQPLILPNWTGSFEDLPESIANRPFWQYGVGEHSSDIRRIIGSILVSANTDSGNTIWIRHLIIEGSSQWVVGRNVTRYCNIIHIGENKLCLPPSEVGNDSISLVNEDLHCYIPSKAFFKSSSVSGKAIFCATGKLSNSIDAKNLPWSNRKAIIDRVHLHVCGHSSFSDMKTLLQRNDLYDDNAAEYLAQVLDECTSCKVTSQPKPNRKVSLSSLSKEFNKEVCIDHLYLGDSIVFHAMDSATRYSAGCCVIDTNMEHSIEAFESQWISQFWYPQVVIADPAFNNTLFKKYLTNCGISIRPIPPRRHSKNVLESKHRVLRDIFLRLKHANENSGFPE